MAADDISDAKISEAVSDQLFSDEATPSHLIDVVTLDGVVTLTGSVDNVLARRRATDVAEAVKGVRSVVNRVTVNPVYRTDAQIKNDIVAALVADPAADSYELDVQVDDGTVRLTGTVESWQEKRTAELVALGVMGVKDVDNDVVIKYRKKRSDFEIEKDVEARLKYDTLLDDRMLDVDVRNGEVKLSGSVASAAERRLAERDSWVAGVSSVDSDGVDIRWWARDDMTRSGKYVHRTDEEIEEAVEDALFMDPRVFSFGVSADAVRGRVTLSGVVDNLAASKAAEQDARNTLGVYDVNNRIRVRPEALPDNEVLATRVRDAITRDPYVSRFDVSVTAVNGKVYLDGEVNNSFERRQAGAIASRVKGVVIVDNNLDYEHTWSWKPDWEIRQDVEGELFWSPYVDSDEVTVDVINGIVTLTGQVDSYKEKSAAEENAFEGGAKDVRNHLSVSYDPYYSYLR
jgi:osmotically-inducible protein OsmY